MARQLKYQVLAILLLLVFSINTLTGFACSIGVDMGYNRQHHHPASMKPMSMETHCTMHQKGASLSPFNSSDDCCSGVVTAFNQMDKNLVTNYPGLLEPTFFLSVGSSYGFKFALSNTWLKERQQPFFRRSCFLNDTSIRIAIRSFQI